MRDKIVSLDEDVADARAAVVHQVVDACYDRVSRCTTSAFMRMKLGESSNQRGLAAHIFETRDEALEVQAAE